MQQNPDPGITALCNGWLSKADEDRDVARHLFDENSMFLHAITFHAQQAAEKYLKALLVFQQIEFPKTHDLAELLDLISTVDKDCAEKLAPIDELNPYAIEIRYPGEYPDISFEDAKHAVELAELARTTILQILGRKYSS